MKKKKIKYHCWICEKADIKESPKELHDYILEMIRVKSMYHLAMSRLCEFLIGEEEHHRLANQFPQSDYNGNPMNHALNVLSKCGLRR